MIFSLPYALDILPALLAASLVTIEATLASMLVAVVLGLVLALLRRASTPWVRLPTGAVIEFIRSTPLLIQIFFIYYVLPLYGLRVPTLACGIAALGLHYATYLSEVYRAGIEAVPRGQWEAAKALNYTPRETWLKVILPQAIPPMVPALGNYTILMFKDSSLLSIIAVPELATVARNATLQTDMPLQVFAITAAVYFIALFCISAASRACERRVSRMLPHGH